MKLKIAFQMDPISDVDINGDTSFRLAEEGPQIIWWPQWKIREMDEGEAPEVLDESVEIQNIANRGSIDISGLRVIYLKANDLFYSQRRRTAPARPLHPASHGACAQRRRTA